MHTHVYTTQDELQASNGGYRFYDAPITSTGSDECFFLQVRTYVCMHPCMYGCMYVCTYSMMLQSHLQEVMIASFYSYVCVHASMYVCMYVCMHIFYDAPITSTGSDDCFFLQVHSYCKRMHMYAHVFVCMRMYAYVCACMYVCVYVCMYVCTYSIDTRCHL